MIRAIQSLWVQSEVYQQNACKMPLLQKAGCQKKTGLAVFSGSSWPGLAYKFRIWGSSARRGPARWLIAVIRLVSSRPAWAVVFACLRVQLEPTNCGAKTVIAYKYRTSWVCSYSCSPSIPTTPRPRPLNAHCPEHA